MNFQVLFKKICEIIKKEIQEDINIYINQIKENNKEIKNLKEIINKHEKGIFKLSDFDFYKDAFKDAAKVKIKNKEELDKLLRFFETRSSRKLMFLYEYFVKGLSRKEIAKNHGLSYGRVHQLTVIMGWFPKGINEIIFELKSKDYLGMK